MNEESNNNQNNGVYVPNIPNAVLFSKKNSNDRFYGCPLENENIDYKNLELISKYISDRGRILPARINGVSRKNHRKLTNAIKRARDLGLLPYVKMD